MRSVPMRGWYVDREHEHPIRRRRCGHPLAWADEVGWVDSAPGEAYDMCEADPYGNHQPLPIGSGPQP